MSLIKFKSVFKNNNKSYQNEIDKLPENIQTKETYKHSINYSKLLDLYIKSTKHTIYLKLYFKILFFVSTIGSLIAIVCIFFKSLNYAFTFFDEFKDINSIKIEAILSITTILLPAVSSFIVAFLKMPEIIAKYLFNVEEDRYMDSIIKNIQDYDKEMFIVIQQKIMDSLLEKKNGSIKETDDDIEDLDNINEDDNEVQNN